MKKFLLSLVSLFMLTFAVQAGAPYKLLTFPGNPQTSVNNYTSEWTATIGEDVWTLYGFNNNQNKWELVKCGSTKAAITATITSPAVDAAITNVIISVLQTSNVTSATLTVLNDGEPVGDPIDITDIFKAGEVNVEVAGEPGYSYKLTIENEKTTSNGTTQIGKVALFEEGQFVEVHIANTAETAYTVAEAYDIIDAGNALGETVYVKGIVSQVDKFNDNFKSIQYWISDDGTTDKQLECYSGKGIDGADFAAIEDVVAGAEVIVKGTLTKYGEVYEFTQNNELVSYEAPAEPEPEPLFVDGKYYFKNVGSGFYWGAGNDWGTRASLLKNPDFLTLHNNEDGTYKLESQVSNGGTAYYFNGSYMDNDAPVSLTITPLENGYYTIANGGVFYGYNGENTILGELASGSEANAQWQIIPEAEMLASLSTATAENPVDATFLIIDHTFGRNHRNVAAWTNEGSAALTGGNSNKHDAEKYHGVFNVYQKLANAPAGVYKFTAQGFYRQDGSDNENLPVFYANTETSAFPFKTGTENSMADACASFEKGLYPADPIFVQVTEAGELTIGAKLETNTTLWCIWDNFELTYYGADADLNTIKFGDLVTELAEQRAIAERTARNENISAGTATALQTAIEGAQIETPSEEAYKTAIAALKGAIAQANLDINNKAALDALTALAEATNVYTAEAYTTFKEALDAQKLAFEAGTLTETVVNPNIVAGWHSSNTFDDLLLSAWSVGETKCADFAAPLYINTWSTEGENDGSQFIVPFFEYWTGDDNSLGANALTANLTGVEAGFYDVTAWVRVRAKNGTAAADATGITLAVNGGTAVDVTEGAPVGESQFAIAEVKARGAVGEDGVMNIVFNVDADNNISWLSFKNVKYTKVDATEAYYDQALEQIKAGNFYQVTTTVGETTYYLTGEGKLTADAEAATSFEFKQEPLESGFKPIGWNLGYRFTNPSMSGQNGTGDVVNEGMIRPDSKNNRVDYERQVFFFNGEKYAVRSTNNAGTAWGANTYWDVIEGGELPTAGYSLEMQYKWNLVDVTAASARNALIADITATNAIVVAREGVGAGLFQKSEAELQALADAVTVAQAVAENAEATAEQIQEARTALAAANTAYANGGTQPNPNKAYIFTLTTSGGEFNLNFSADGVKIAEEATPTYFVSMEGGTFALSNGEDTPSYVNYAGSNAWTTSASSEAYGWTIALADGGYTIKGKNGYLGTNTSDGNAVNSPIYGDKKMENGNCIWTIAEVAGPEPDPNDYTSYIINADLSDAASTAWNLEGTKGYHNVGGVVTAGNNAVYDFNQTIVGLPAGKYQVSVQAAYRYGADEQAEANAYFDDAIETKFAKLYATVGEKTVNVLVKNRYDGASDTDWANGEGSVVVEGKPVPNSTAAVKAWFDAKQYTNVLEFNLVEAGNVTIGIVKTAQPEAGDYTVIGPWTLTRIGDAETEPEPQEQVLNKEINVERYIGLGYVGQIETVDFTEALEFLGVEAVTYDMLRIVNPDDTEISDYAPYDGWFNGEGVAETWGANTKINVKFFEAIPDGEFSICDMNGADVVDAEYSVKWALVNGDKKVVYTVNVKFIEPEPVVIEILDNVIEASVDYETSEGSYSEKRVALTSDQISAICAELGVESLEGTTAYGYNPTTKELVANYAGFDGWRDANGDFHNWTGDGNAPACVKYVDGQSFLCYNIAGLEPQTIDCYWAIATETKAVLVKISFNYVIPVGINGLNSELKNANIFDLNGRKVSKVQKGGIYIVNGKKMLMK